MGWNHPLAPSHAQPDHYHFSLAARHLASGWAGLANPYPPSHSCRSAGRCGGGPGGRMITTTAAPGDPPRADGSPIQVVRVIEQFVTAKPSLWRYVSQTQGLPDTELRYNTGHSKAGAYVDGPRAVRVRFENGAGSLRARPEDSWTAIAPQAPNYWVRARDRVAYAWIPRRRARWSIGGLYVCMANVLLCGAVGYSARNRAVVWAHPFGPNSQHWDGPLLIWG